MYTLSKNLNRIVFLLIAFGLLIFLILPTHIIRAQIFSDTFLQITPQNPRSREEVAVEIKTSQIDLNRAQISWFVNDTPVHSGIGESGIRFVTGSVGISIRVTASIETFNGNNLTRSITIRPSEVDILWNPISYTPPFYKGKALSSSAGLVILSAIPNIVGKNGKRIDSGDLIYTWRERGVVLGNASGFGKQQIILENGHVSQRPLSVSVTVTSFDGFLESKQNINIPIHEPQIVFYKKHPLEGTLYEQALDNSFALQDEELVIRAEPFFFSLDDVINNLLRYRWKINDRDISIPLNEQGNEVTIRREGDESGVAKISIEIANFNTPFRVLQKAEKKIDVSLGL